VRHVYVWSCKAHTAGKPVLREAEVSEGEEFEPCGCANSYYIPLLYYSDNLFQPFDPSDPQFSGVVVDDHVDLTADNPDFATLLYRIGSIVVIDDREIGFYVILFDGIRKAKEAVEKAEKIAEGFDWKHFPTELFVDSWEGEAEIHRYCR